MKLDISLVQHNGNNCVEDLYATVASYWNINYEMAFIHAWNFSFESNKLSSSQLIGKRIRHSKGNEPNFLNKYHGLKINEFEITQPKKVYEYVNDELAHNNPVAIKIPIFWIPWANDYKQKGAMRNHYVLIIGIDDFNNFICLDTLTRNGNEYEILPYDNFCKGISGFICFNKEVPNYDGTDWKTEIQNAVNRLYVEDNFGDMFARIKYFSNIIKYHINIEKEIEGYTNIWNSPLLSNLREVSYGRIQFANALKYICKRQNFEILLPLCNELILAGSNWDTARSLLIKGYLSSNLVSAQKRAASKINDIAELEFNIAKKLLKILNSSEVTTLNNTNYNENNNLLNNSIKEIINVDLSSLLNNNAFGTLYDNCTADLTGYNQFLLKETLPTVNTWNINNMSFIFPTIEEGRYDNISCQNQTIFIDKDYYSSIMILGCAERGNYSDVLRIKYCTEVCEDLNIKFTDLGRKPLFNEYIVWSGKGAEIKNGKVQYINNDLNNKMYLFAKEYFINSSEFVEQLLLPECPNIHVFAISLKKKDTI